MTQPDIFDDDAPWAEWLPELRMILFAYNSVLDDPSSGTPEAPSKAMRSYLRMATYYPGRAFRATAEILEVLKRGLDSPEVAAELATMPHMAVPQGRTREDCLKMMVPHLVAFTESGEHTEPAVPETDWEWRERLPNLSELLGGYYHQSAMDYLFPDVEDDRYDDAVLADYSFEACRELLQELRKAAGGAQFVASEELVDPCGPMQLSQMQLRLQLERRTASPIRNACRPRRPPPWAAKRVSFELPLPAGRPSRPKSEDIAAANLTKVVDRCGPTQPRTLSRSRPTSRLRSSSPNRSHHGFLLSSDVWWAPARLSRPRV